jgi:hypothetical protein
MDLLTTISQLTTVIADALIILPFFSRTIRRKLFRAIVVDLIYDIVTGANGQTENMVNTLKGIIKLYEDIKSGKTNIHIESHDD